MLWAAPSNYHASLVHLRSLSPRRLAARLLHTNRLAPSSLLTSSLPP
jgi:hypothetical protein